MLALDTIRDYMDEERSPAMIQNLNVDASICIWTSNPAKS